MGLFEAVGGCLVALPDAIVVASFSCCRTRTLAVLTLTTKWSMPSKPGGHPDEAARCTTLETLQCIFLFYERVPGDCRLGTSITKAVQYAFRRRASSKQVSIKILRSRARLQLFMYQRSQSTLPFICSTRAVSPRNPRTWAHPVIPGLT